MEELNAHRAQCSGPTIEDEEGRLRARSVALLEQHVSDLEKSLENARTERDAALADNAALVGELAKGRAGLVRISGYTKKAERLADEINVALARPHPGAALLELHRKALVVARNAALAEAADACRNSGRHDLASQIEIMGGPVPH